MFMGAKIAARRSEPSLLALELNASAPSVQLWTPSGLVQWCDIVWMSQGTPGMSDMHSVGNR